MKNRKQTRRGFTIVELVIVIAVIAILASVLVPTFDDVISNAKDAAAKEAAKNAYISYVVVHPEQAGVLCIYQTDGRFVAVVNGGVTGVYGTEEEAKAALGLAADAQFSDTGDGKLYISGDVPVVPPVDPTPNPTDWSGATAVFVGDSITAASGAYYNAVGTTLGLNYSGMGISGSCISATSNYVNNNSPLINRWTTIPDADLIVIFMGTNDFGHASTLGSIEDTTDISFYGALNVIIPGIQAAHPNSQLVVITPMHRYHQTGAYNGNVSMSSPEDSVPNAKGATLKDYVDALKAICNKYNVHTIDLFSVAELDPNDSAVKDTYFPSDGLHPNAAGHAKMAEIISGELQFIPRLEGAGQTPTPPVDPAPEPDLTPDYSLRIGNRFGGASYESQTNRLCTTKNIYLKAGTIITIKENSKYDWAIARTGDTTSSNMIGNTYYPENKFTEQGYYVTPADDWYGFTFKKADNSTFDLGGADSADLRDYFIIAEQVALVSGNKMLGRDNVDANRMTSVFNLYLPANTTITFNPGNGVTEFAVSEKLGDYDDCVSRYITGGWDSAGYVTTSQAGYYGLVLKSTTTLDPNAFDLFDFFVISGYND